MSIVVKYVPFLAMLLTALFADVKTLWVKDGLPDGLSDGLEGHLFHSIQ